MTTPERYAAKVSEMQRTLEYRFAGWGLKDADVKAHELVQELVRAGWRPYAPVTALPPRPTVVALPTEDYTEARAKLRAARQIEEQP